MFNFGNKDFCGQNISNAIATMNETIAGLATQKISLEQLKFQKATFNLSVVKAATGMDFDIDLTKSEISIKKIYKTATSDEINKLIEVVNEFAEEVDKKYLSTSDGFVDLEPNLDPKNLLEMVSTVLSLNISEDIIIELSKASEIYRSNRFMKRGIIAAVVGVSILAAAMWYKKKNNTETKTETNTTETNPEETVEFCMMED